VIGFAILGPGKVAHTHAQVLANIPGAQLVAVCGRNPERTQAFASTHQARAWTDYAAVLEQPDVHAVVICTPHPQHADQAILAMRAGKHVLVEKPMATTPEDCARMIETANAHQRKLGIISQRRNYAPVQRLKKAILEGKIGRPILGTLSLLGWRSPEYYAMDEWRGTWAGEGGGVLVNQAVHQIDLLLWLLGSRVTRIQGESANLNHPSIEVEDTAVATLRCENGALGSIVASNSQNPGLWGRIEIHGSNGASIGVQTDGGSMFISGVTNYVEPPINHLWTIPGEAQMLEIWQAQDRALAAQNDVMTHYHQLQIEDFVQSILEDRSPEVSAEAAKSVVEVFAAIYKNHQ
jgi:UDP-N-acetyl-2-amino-2-deoxyglucuronate dehydrogenase